MNAKSLVPLVTALFIGATCGVLGAESQQQLANPAGQKQAQSAQNDDVVGEWELMGSVVDTDDNLQRDDAERSALKKPSYKDYMKLNRDGRGEFTVARIPGRYEITATGTGGRRYLNWFDKSNGRHRVGTILKVIRQELLIKEPGGHGMILWQRL
jgi:hypothetical protein